MPIVPLSNGVTVVMRLFWVVDWVFDGLERVEGVEVGSGRIGLWVTEKPL